jgi:hypothetical protein
MRLVTSDDPIFGVGITVHRENALDFSGCNSRPGTGSRHPLAIEAAGGGNEAVGAFDGEVRWATPASVEAITRVNAEQARASRKGWHTQWETVPPG